MISPTCHFRLLDEFAASGHGQGGVIDHPASTPEPGYVDVTVPGDIIVVHPDDATRGALVHRLQAHGLPVTQAHAHLRDAGGSSQASVFLVAADSLHLKDLPGLLLWSRLNPNFRLIFLASDPRRVAALAKTVPHSSWADVRDPALPATVALCLHGLVRDLFPAK